MPNILPDLLRPNLDIVFCGTAAGNASARQKAYYAGPGNRFWEALHATGLTPRRLRPDEYPQLLGWGVGLTDICKTISGGDDVLRRLHFDAGRLASVVAEHTPRILAFTSKRAAQEFLDMPVDYGLQSRAIGSTRLFVLTSPSGAARRYWDIGPWTELAALKQPHGSAS